MFTSFESYEQFIYELPSRYPSIHSSTLVLVRRGRYIAFLCGEIHFTGTMRLQIYEELAAVSGVRITGYGYEAWRGDDKLYWYDSQPHPHVSALAENHPHHKHVPPDIKHNRIIAPDLSFTQSNLPFLIEEMVQLLTDS